MSRTDNCNIRRRNETPEISMIFAIREKFPKARLNGAQVGNAWLWRIVDGPFKDMEWCNSIEEAWTRVAAAVQGVEWNPEMVRQLRGKS